MEPNLEPKKSDPVFHQDIMNVLIRDYPHTWEALNSTDKNIRLLVHNFINDVNQQIIKTFPSLFNKIDILNSVENNPPEKFKRLLASVHQEARRLGVDKSPSESLSSTDRMNWEFSNFKSLISATELKTQEVMEQDYEKFVLAIADKLGIPQAPGIPAKMVWDQIMQQHRQLQQIDRLGLSSRKFNFLPSEIGMLTSLKKLYLNNNNLSNLPVEITSLGRLTDLELDKNKLSSIPEELRLLPKLDILTLRSNNLTEVPSNWEGYSNLRLLYLDDNPIKNAPKNIPALDARGVKYSLPNFSDDLTSKKQVGYETSGLELA